MQTISPTTESLQRHQSRRRHAVPTLTTFVGPAGLAIRAWREWSAKESRSCVVVFGNDQTALLRQWVEAAFAVSPPVARACEWLTAVTKGSPDKIAVDLRQMTQYDLDQLLRSHSTDTRRPAAAVASVILADHLAGVPTDVKRLVETVTSTVDGPARVVRAICELSPPESWPTLLLAAPEPAAQGWGHTAGRIAEQIVVVEPRLPVALSLPVAEYDRLVRSQSGSRVTRLFREGVVELHSVSGNQLETQFQRAGVPVPAPTVVTRLTETGLAPEVATAFVAATHAIRKPSATEVDSDFRSIHEEFLFGLLESMPRTAGLFRPNRELGFRHGHQPAEADLLAESLKLVVEIDGSHYHLNTEQFRRDRRKDWLYQRHGYLVLRFLAEDVVSDLELILDTILEAVELRRPTHSIGAP